MGAKTWSNSRAERLEAVRALSQDDIVKIHDDLTRDCPVEPWPYGNSTTINPILLTLGASPGDSPSQGDLEYFRRSAQPMPPAGQPHPGVYYEDPRNYWSRVRRLAFQVLAHGPLSNEDALALFGNVNLDTGASGEAERVKINDEYAEWLLLNIRDRLRPRILVCLGLSTYFKNNPTVKKQFERLFDGVELGRPQKVYGLESYRKKKFSFKEWDIVCPHGNEVRVVVWPQHPSRHPMTLPGVWRGACEQFSRRATELFL